MDIELIRAWAPDELKEDTCAICEQRFMAESVRAVASWKHGGDPGHLCPTCIEHLSQHPSGRFDTLREYEAVKRRYPEPIWSSEDELQRADPEWEWTAEQSKILRA
jgi:hypothetical protein